MWGSSLPSPPIHFVFEHTLHFSNNRFRRWQKAPLALFSQVCISSSTFWLLEKCLQAYGKWSTFCWRSSKFLWFVDTRGVHIVLRSASVLLMWISSPNVSYGSVSRLIIVWSFLSEWVRATASSAYCSSTTDVGINFVFERSLAKVYYASFNSVNHLHTRWRLSSGDEEYSCQEYRDQCWSWNTALLHSSYSFKNFVTCPLLRAVGAW